MTTAPISAASSVQPVSGCTCRSVVNPGECDPIVCVPSSCESTFRIQVRGGLFFPGGGVHRENGL